MDSTEALLKNLTEARAISGHEAQVRAIMKDRLAPLGEISFDRLGSLLCEVRGRQTAPRVMVAAHMDEIGFLVRDITPEGALRLAPVGAWCNGVLPAQRFVIQTRQGELRGTIGFRPPHGQPAEERTKVPPILDLYLDLGACSRLETEQLGVRIGDPVVPVAPFEILRQGVYMAKALDNRAACAVLVEALERLKQSAHPNTVIGAATVQEEVSSENGAEASVALVKPDAAIVLEVGGARDMPDVPAGPKIVLGGGPLMRFADPGMPCHPRMLDWAFEVAQKADIPIQRIVSMGGTTDGRSIHTYNGGVPTIVVSVPSRYIHNHSGIMRRSDFDHTVEFIVRMLCSLNSETFRQWLVW